MNQHESEIACGSQPQGGTLHVYRVLFQEPQWAFSAKIPQRYPLHHSGGKETVNLVKHTREFSVTNANSEAERLPGPCSTAEGTGTSSRQLLLTFLTYRGRGRAGQEDHLGRPQAGDTGAPSDSDFIGFPGYPPWSLAHLELCYSMRDLRQLWCPELQPPLHRTQLLARWTQILTLEASLPQSPLLSTTSATRIKL